jgi:MutL-like protein
MTDYHADTILAADFGTATTRVSLFDVVEGTFRYVASGESPSTIEPPYLEASEGMRHALAELQAITGRAMLDESSRLIMPATADGSGMDVFVVTASGGPAVRAALVGLLPDVSLDSALRLAASGYISVLDTLSLSDRRREEQQVDALLAARPNLILITGGTDGGARDAVLKLTDTVSLACRLLAHDTKPNVVYVGNSALREQIVARLADTAIVSTAPNLVPELGAESPAPARAELARVFQELRLAQIGGFHDLAGYAGGRILPTAQAEGTIVRYLSRALGTQNGILSVDVGSATTSVAAAFGGELYLNVRPDLGVGVNAAAVLSETSLAHLARWIPQEIGEDALRDFVFNKALRPHTLPADAADLQLEHALAREVLRASLRTARAGWPRAASASRAGVLPWCDLIVGGGAVLGQAPRPGASALLLLDALQPTGVTTLLLDSHHILAALGAAAYLNPLAVVQAFDSSFLTLGMGIAAIGAARPDAVVCQARLVYENGTDLAVDVKAGTLEVLPLPLGQDGKLTLKPRSGIDVGFGPGRSKTFEVTGGAVGVIIDARGRPIVFPKTADKRFEMLQQWSLKIAATV